MQMHPFIEAQQSPLSINLRNSFLGEEEANVMFVEVDHDHSILDGGNRIIDQIMQ